VLTELSQRFKASALDRERPHLARWSLYVTEPLDPLSRREIVFGSLSAADGWQADDDVTAKATSSGWDTFGAYFGQVGTWTRGTAFDGARATDDPAPKIALWRRPEPGDAEAHPKLRATNPCGAKAKRLRSGRGWDWEGLLTLR